MKKKISLLKFHPQNKILYGDTGPDQVTDLAENIGTYGQITPVVINKSGVILSGHRRIAALKLLGPAQGHEACLRVFWPSTLPSNDGSGLGEKCSGLEAERLSRITQWRDGSQTDFKRPVPEIVTSQEDVPSCPLSPIGRRILGLDLWPEGVLQPPLEKCSL